MTESILPVLAIALNYLGLHFLALSQNRHWHKVMATSVSLTFSQKITSRMLGYGLLVSALVILILDNGFNFGTLSWVILQAPLAMAVSLILAWRAELLRPISRAMLLRPPELFGSKANRNLNRK